MLFFSVNYGTDEHIKVEVIEAMVTKLTPEQVLTGADPGLAPDVYVGNLENNYNVMCSFLMHYLFCAHPSLQKIKLALQAASIRRFIELDGPKDPDYDHKCLLCFMTASDLAFVLWQYRNSYTDWIAKLKNQSLKYKHDSKWTSDKKMLGMDDRDENDEGVKAYKECLNWSRELKKMSKSHEYWKLRKALNQKAESLGYLKEWGKDGGVGDGEAAPAMVRKEVPETAPSYTIDEWDSIPEMEF